MSYKLILVQADDDCGCYGECSCDPTLSVKDITLGGLAQTANYALKQDLVNFLTSLVKSGDEQAIQALKNLGWVNLTSVKDREERLVAGKKFYYCDKTNSYSRMVEFDLDTMTKHRVSDLARSGVVIAQEVTKTSLKRLMTKEQRAAYDKEVKRLNADKKRKAEAAAKKKEAKKAKEIEKAKKLLEEAGEC